MTKAHEDGERMSIGPTVFIVVDKIDVRPRMIYAVCLSAQDAQRWLDAHDDPREQRHIVEQHVIVDTAHD